MAISHDSKARLSSIRSEIALRRHAESRASGKPARFGELTPERREAQRNGRLGKLHKPETKAAIADGVRAFHRTAYFTKQGIMSASIFAPARQGRNTECPRK